MIQQMQILDQKIGRNEPRVEIHRQHDQDRNRLAEYIFFPADRIGQHRRQEKAEHVDSTVLATDIQKAWKIVPVAKIAL